MKYIIKRFEKLTTNELYEILKIRTKVFVVEQKCIYQDLDDKDKTSYHIICYDNDKIVGYLRIIDKNISYNEIAIGRVLTAIEYRRKGIATNLMKEAMTFIENKLKEKTIKISAQEYLIKFYENLGFKAIGEKYLEDDIPHVEMIYNNEK